MPKATQEDERQIKPFADWLALQRKGTLAAELAESLADLNRAVVETGKAGSVTLVINVKSNGDDTSVTITDDVKTKVPTPDRGKSIFFVDEHGNAERSQQVLVPDQPRLTAVPGASVADAETGEVL